MEIERASEAQRLIEHYSRMFDGDLLNLAVDSADLTEVAQRVLRDELKKRGLNEIPDENAHRGDSKSPASVPPAAWETYLNLPSEHGVNEEAAASHEYSWKTPLRECKSREEAWQIYELLRRAGIESWIESPTSYAIELSGQRVVVAADQLDQAREIASQPIPQDIIDESSMKVPEYELPTCPHCGAADPLLETVDPVNAWLCESCECRWNDPAEAPSEAGEQ